eukprot:570796-Heterocapsa_arctica.AAC.1
MNGPNKGACGDAPTPGELYGTTVCAPPVVAFRAFVDNLYQSHGIDRLARVGVCDGVLSSLSLTSTDS